MKSLTISYNFNKFLLLFKSKPIFERALIIFWLSMPFIMMISKSLADLFIVIIGVSFLIKSTSNSSWSWLKNTWIRSAILFFIVSNISACFSLIVETSLSNGIAWIRFPLFAAAISIWIIKEREIFYFALIINFLSIIFIFTLMGLETIFTDHKSFEWPFRNPLNGPFIHRIGILFFTISFLVLFLDLKYKTQASIFLFISIIFSLLSGNRSGNFTFVIMIFILTFWPVFNMRKSIIITIYFFIVLFLFFILNLEKLDRYFFEIYNLNNTSLLQYIGQWKTGLVVFFENPLIGIGPTNVQNYLSENLIINYDPFQYNEHPHNHYIQAFAETGLVGGSLYIITFLVIIINSYKYTKNKGNTLDQLISQGIFITSICIFWPFALNYDLFGQQQNSYLWYVISIILVSHKVLKSVKLQI